MRVPRVSIRFMMTVIVYIGLGIAALKTPTALCAGLVTTLTTTALLFASVGAIAKRGNERLPYLGFAIFGLGYYMLYFVAVLGPASISNTTYCMDALGNLFPVPELSPSVPTQLVIPDHPTKDDIIRSTRRDSFASTSLCLVILLNAVVGSILARFFATNQDDSKATDRP